MSLNSNSILKAGATITSMLPRKLHDFLSLRLAKIKANGRVRREVFPGVFLELDLSDWLQRLYYMGLLENSIFSQLKNLIPVGATVIDIGAYIGLFTCVMADHVGPKGSVVVFEPMQQCFEQLQDNIRLNRFHNVKAKQIAISNHAGSIDLYLPEVHCGGTSAIAQVWNPGNWKAFSRIPCAPLDSAFDKTQLHLIKIDVQGHELEVLEGARQTIDHFHPIIFCEVEAQNYEKVFDLLRSFGYDVFMENLKGCLNLYLPTNTKMQHDFFFIPQEKIPCQLSAL